MTKSYADRCLELAEEATLKNELTKAYKYQPCNNGHGSDLYAVSWNGTYRLVERVREDLADDVVKTWEFFIISREMVPELAKRLKRACEYLRLEAICSKKDILKRIADELEAPLEEK